MHRKTTIYILLLAIAAPALCQTIVPGGNVSGVWSANDSPFLVTGEITVQPTDTLTIDPGVSVIFQGHYKFIVNGWLEAVGTEQDSIIITSSDTTEARHTLRFIDAPDSSHLSYCLITLGYATGVSPQDKGGGIFIENSCPVVTNCTITENRAWGAAGIRCQIDANAVIRNCVITNNTATEKAGGIMCHGSEPIIEDCIIANNVAYNYGGAFNFIFSSPTIERCLIVDNHAVNQGIVRAQNESNPVLNKCIFIDNVMDNDAIFYSYSYSSITLQNCIVWNNSTPLFDGEIQVEYCDVEGGTAGTGNIDMEPLFLNADQDDYRLQWISPCIDTGNPDIFYNDPDATRADMGALYFDQNAPVSIRLTLFDNPVIIPETGGHFDFNIQVVNTEQSSNPVRIWTDVTRPSGSTIGPIIGPVQQNILGNIIINRLRTQNVPAFTASGTYHYNAYAIAGSDTSYDSFTFTVLGSSDVDQINGWFSYGDDITNLGNEDPVNQSSEKLELYQCNPNPFNPGTTITFELGSAENVQLTLFNIQGKEVTRLVDGYRNAGFHSIYFDASNLASGIYLYRLKAGNLFKYKKMILTK